VNPPIREGTHSPWSRERQRARIWRAVARPVNLCDVCHKETGVGFTDMYWMCIDCSARFLKRLEAERI
jgi:ribosomal protein L37AE/L43A